MADGTYQTYRTKQLLSDAGGVYLQGRGTRVWTAVRLENGSETGELVVLKDSWVDEYREREGSINNRIRRAAVLQEDRDKLDASIVQVALYGDVYVAGVPDRTRLVPDSECLIGLVLQSLSAITDRVNPRRAASSKKRLFTGPQIHTRIVYKDVGRPISNARLLSPFFSALAKVTEGVHPYVDSSCESC